MEEGGDKRNYLGLKGKEERGKSSLSRRAPQGGNKEWRVPQAADSSVWLALKG